MYSIKGELSRIRRYSIFM